MDLDFRDIIDLFEKNKTFNYGNDPEGVPRVTATKEAIVISNSDASKGIAVTEGYGTGILGPLTLCMDPSEIRLALLWKVNPVILTSLPSTIYTPVPFLRPDVPIFNMTEIATSVAIATAGLVAAAAL